jgi:hypothetical protein
MKELPGMKKERCMNSPNCMRGAQQGYEQQKILLLHLKEHEKISRLAV